MQQVISAEELKTHNGEHGTRLWIAEGGFVYDVTDCPKWRTGMHENLHFPGLDLSSEIPEAPHGREIFERPCVKLVGQLKAAS